MTVDGATILVTGATGNIGGEVVRQLAAGGQRVRALLRDRSRAAGIRAARVRIVVGDMARRESLGGPLEGIERVFLSSPDLPAGDKLSPGRTCARSPS